MINIKIHRGTNQIGGTITEVFTENTHIFIDFGSELCASPEESTDGAMVEMLKHSACDAVLFSHYHGDHVGLFQHIPENDVRGKQITLGMGKVARQVLLNIHETLAEDARQPVQEQNRQKQVLELLQAKNRWLDFYDESAFDIGDFHITTIRVDHSAYDAYLFVIEADGECVVHTGDFRTHGRLGAGLFEKLERFFAEKKVDVLLIEGTMMGRGSERVITEEELQMEAEELLAKEENKYAFLVCSSTNVESLASFHNAVWETNKRLPKEKRKPFLVNRYVMKQIELYRETIGTENKEFYFRKTYPLKGFHYREKKLSGKTQMEFVKETGFFMLIGPGEGYRKYLDEFMEYNPLLIYSMWKGYVEDETSETYDVGLGMLYKSMRHVDLHTSGHAVKADLERMILLTNPEKSIIPIHTEHQKRFRALDIGELKNKVKCLCDGEVFYVLQNK